MCRFSAFESIFLAVRALAQAHIFTALSGSIIIISVAKICSKTRNKCDIVVAGLRKAI